MSLRWCHASADRPGKHRCGCMWCRGECLGVPRQNAMEEGGEGAGGILAICVHGKSGRPALWRLADLLRSCGNLCCAREDIRGGERGAMVVPDSLEELRGCVLSLSAGS